jgi:hypothetical protein
MNELAVVIQHYLVAGRSSKSSLGHYLSEFAPIIVSIILGLILSIFDSKIKAVIQAIFRRPSKETTVITHVGGRIYNVRSEDVVVGTRSRGSESPGPPTGADRS